ncbi:MAG: hypothetical protein GWO08_12655 [Gammaproteobacteria bacterium]|nr:hypothetical protein [Gammaproteobacteria bacterium]NIN60985.1 hypothetical protein [Gammaproteobacteria bacterium]NIO62609.1 hypothetical protein [Gammaproteobacteria bacterium]NIP49474.1 hypothetical protein [Gammaproteobacteria bacterium]NIQ18768.1 hypothetical protein [Gammaproteobacteria bacterium]
MDAHLIAVLLSWTVHLSGYPHPGDPPEIQYRPHEFFVEHACLGNKNCRVAGWYNDEGVIYIDERLREQRDAYTRSLYVHEITHYLQDLNNKYNKKECTDHQKREREAYSIQRQYLNKIAGRFTAIYINYPPCPIS